MNRKHIFSAGIALLIFSAGAMASSVPLDVTNPYAFYLDGFGGGATATLNGVTVEIFCDDFDNSIGPNDYSANVTTLGTSANLSQTRFGDVTSWETITLSTGNSATDSADETFFNSGSGATAAARYDMVAYLVSLYNQSLGNNPSNNEIQAAIWNLMDPTAEGPSSNPDRMNLSSDLEQAASWYMSMSSDPTALNAFLSQFEVVSPTNMSYTNGLGYGGFQEQIVMTPTPEPRAAVFVLLALLATAFLVTRHKRDVGRAASQMA